MFFLPETSASNILLRRASRLRKASGNDKIRSQTEIDRRGISFSAIVIDAIWKPIEICIKDPAVEFELHESLGKGYEQEQEEEEEEEYHHINQYK